MSTSIAAGVDDLPCFIAFYLEVYQIPIIRLAKICQPLIWDFLPISVLVQNSTRIDITVLMFILGLE